MRLSTRKIVYSIFILVLLGFGVVAYRYLTYRYGGIKYITLKPFAQECGLSGVMGPHMACQCQGVSFREQYIAGGSDPVYCLGKCGACECSWDGPDEEDRPISKKVPCDEIEKHQDWNFETWKYIREKY